jgi:ATP-dependent Lhr-like helicase
LIGNKISEDIGSTVVIQHDPYRIFIQTMGLANSDQIMSIFNEIKESSKDVITEQLSRTAVKTGLFKRRIVHVARRFGALEKWADFSRVSLQSLVKSFEGTAIYDEALKEAFTRDLDLRHTLLVFQDLKKGVIDLIKLETKEAGTPIAHVGIERIRMKTDLIPTDRIRMIIIESAKARLLNEVRTFVCTKTNCLNYLETIRLRDLPDKLICPNCGTSSIGVLQDEEDKIFKIVAKKGRKLTVTEKKTWKSALETAKLMKKYGKIAAVILSGKGLKISDAKEVLLKESMFTDHFYELVVEAEREALKRKFWITDDQNS